MKASTGTIWNAIGNYVDVSSASITTQERTHPPSDLSCAVANIPESELEPVCHNDTEDIKREFAGNKGTAGSM